MTLHARRFAARVVRLWTRIYTWRLPPALRDARREEIESDLWQSEHDPDTGSHLFALTRLVLGVPDDLGWRLEQEGTMSRFMKLRIAIAAVMALGLALWVVFAATLSQVSPPDAPPSPVSAGIGYLPAPPPPPPPPAWDNQKRIDVQFSYGRMNITAARAAEPPVPLTAPQPIYPPIARAYGLRGEVVLEATVDREGRVVSSRVVRSIPVLDEAAINAIRQWRFHPRMVNGVPVPVLISVRATFG